MGSGLKSVLSHVLTLQSPAEFWLPLAVTNCKHSGNIRSWTCISEGQSVVSAISTFKLSQFASIVQNEEAVGTLLTRSSKT